LAIASKLVELADEAVPLAGLPSLYDDPELWQMAAELRELVNAERVRAGASELINMEILNVAAAIRAAECELLYSHTRPDGRSFETLFDDLGIVSRGKGENLDIGTTSASETVRRWMDSSTHRECMLLPDWEMMGVGIHRGADGTLYWALLLIG